MTARPLVLAVLGCFVLSVRAEAYIDPSAGGTLVQLLLAGSAGVAVVGRLFWSRIVNALGSMQRHGVDRSIPDDSRV